MSWQLVNPRPDCDDPCPDDLEMVILPRSGDLGGFEVLRALPFKHRRLVGPFIFWDQMGPGEFLRGQGVDVRPHPHIGLSTLTYLFDGTLDHRDSLGTYQTITPGAVNLMTAGSGIVHSERTGPEVRQQPSRLYGIQSWVASPKSREEAAPAFQHYDQASLPTWQDAGVQGRVLCGSFAGVKSPLVSDWETLYVDFQLAEGARVTVPPEAEERALYVLEGAIQIGDVEFAAGRMLVLKPRRSVDLKATRASRLLLLGGATLDGPRYIWWNFVSSSQERIEQAKRDWKEGRFAAVPGETEFIPLPAI